MLGNCLFFLWGMFLSVAGCYIVNMPVEKVHSEVSNRMCFCLFVKKKNLLKCKCYVPITSPFFLLPPCCSNCLHASFCVPLCYNDLCFHWWKWRVEEQCLTCFFPPIFFIDSVTFHNVPIKTSLNVVLKFESLFHPRSRKWNLCKFTSSFTSWIVTQSKRDEAKKV